MDASTTKSTSPAARDLVIALLPKSSPARHRVTSSTLPQHRASYLIKSVSASHRRAR